jgi:signal transduction histidine kinase
MIHRLLIRWIGRFVVIIGLLSVPLLLIGQPSVADWQKQLTQASSDSTRLRLCLTIAQYYYNKTQYDSLYPYVQRGLKLLPKSPSLVYSSELNFLLSRYYRYKGDPKKGLPFSQQAVEQAMQIQTPKRITELQYYLAVIYTDAGDLSKAVTQIGTNLRYLQQHEDGPMRGANYLLMITLFRELKNTVMEDRYWRKYVALDKRSWPALYKMLAHVNMAEYLDARGQINEANSQFRKALYYANQPSVPGAVLRTSYILRALAIIARKQGRYQTSIKLLQQAFTKAKAIHSLGDMGRIKRESALTYLALRRPREALSDARYSLKLSRQLKIRDGIISSLNSLATVLENQGQDRQALLYYQEEQQLKEQKFTEANVQKIALMQAQFDTETKENTIKLLQKNAQINRLNTLHQQEQLALAQRTGLGGLLLIVLLLLVVGLTVYNLGKSRQSNVLLSQQQILIQQTAGQLAESNSVKDKLFSLIAHDLRSPVANMKNSLRQVREPNQQPDQLATLTERLDKQVDNLLMLLTNLLDWSMIQLTGARVSLTPVPLVDIVNNVLSQVNEQVGQKQLTIIKQIHANHIALANSHQLEAVVRNLVTNAIKFTPMGGFIRLVSYQEDDLMELQIKDSGLGMSAEQVAKLFTTPEVRSGTYGEKGTGLGLRLCRDMLERQGGHLHIQSWEGQGTSVRIQLVAAETTPEANQLVAQKDLISG